MPQAAVLRAFELLLLRETGLLPALDEEGSSLSALQPQARYHLLPEAGLRPVPHPDVPALQGEQWLVLQAALDGDEPLAGLLGACTDALGALRQPLRTLLHYHSGVRVFQTRQLMIDVQRLGESPD